MMFKPTIAKRRTPTNICKISILNEDAKLNNVPRIFQDTSGKACLPTDIKCNDPTVVYSLTNTVRSKIFNFNKFVSNLDVKAFIQDNTILRCNCASSGFIDKDIRHIVTEDLRIVGNNKLGKLLTKDPEYRGTNNISRENFGEKVSNIR